MSKNASVLYIWQPGCLFKRNCLNENAMETKAGTTTLRILHLEDNPADAMLVRDQLADDALAAEIHHVARRDEFIAALDHGRWDLILADYRLPDFTGLDALKLVRKRWSSLPFILISGTIGEQAAIDSLKAGATDYVLKQQRDRLPAAVAAQGF